jgi:hypothetical protein
VLSFRHKFLFVHIPKTAGNSLQNILRNYSEDEIVCLAPHQDGVERFEVRNANYNFHKHSTLAEYQRELEPSVFQSLFKFACVRNPWDRLISFYFSPHRGETQWDRARFLELLRITPGISHYLRLPDREASFRNIDFFLKFETLNEDFRSLCSHLRIPPQDLPTRNSSRHEHYSKYYDSELREIVARQYADEIGFFGYEFESK